MVLEEAEKLSLFLRYVMLYTFGKMVIHISLKQDWA